MELNKIIKQSIKLDSIGMDTWGGLSFAMIKLLKLLSLLAHIVQCADNIMPQV